MTFLVLVVASAVLLALAAIVALVRVEKGPTMLDRTLAVDILTATIVGALALEAAYSQRVESVPILVAIALIGFITSVTIARFAAVEPEGEGRVLSREEIAAMESDRLDRQERDDATDDEDHGGPAEQEVVR